MFRGLLFVFASFACFAGNGLQLADRPRPLTRRRFPASFPAVPPFRRIIAALLLALWLPATLHCHLEAAGFGGVFDCSGEHHDSARSASGEPNRDACDVVETGAFKPAANTAIRPAPFLFVCLAAPVAPSPAIELTQPATGVSDLIAAPPEVARTWHFIARAAPPARAPSVG